MEKKYEVVLSYREALEFTTFSAQGIHTEYLLLWYVAHDSTLYVQPNGPFLHYEQTSELGKLITNPHHSWTSQEHPKSGKFGCKNNYSPVKFAGFVYIILC